MDYLKTYHALVNHARAEKRSGYLELHHIVPRCVFGEGLFDENNLEHVNSDENVVYLTAREHFIAHWLLRRAYPNNKKLGLAFWAMAGMFSPDQQRNYIPSSRAIEEARIAATNAKKTPILQYDLDGNYVSEFKSLNEASDRIGIVPNAIGQNLNSLTKSAGGYQWRFKTKQYPKKIESYAIENNGLPIGQYNLKGNLVEKYESLLDAERKTGHSEGSIRAAMNRGSKVKNTSYFFIQFNKHQEIPISVSQYEIPLHGLAIPVVQISADGKYFLNEFHSIRHAEKFFNKKRSHISDACSGKRKTCLGYQWKLKTDYKILLPKIDIELAERKIYSKHVAQYTLKGQYLKTYANSTEAAKSTNTSRGNIVSVANGKRKYSGGFIWAYVVNGVIAKVDTVEKADNISKRILMLNKETVEVVQEFENIGAAATAVSGSRSNISACLNGRRKTAYGHKWQII